MAVYSLCIVEDDGRSARALQDMVARSPFAESFEVTALESRAALEERLSEGARVDVLITDINLGTDKPDGIELVRDLFSGDAKTQVIYVTGYIEYCTPVYETPHIYFLAKPVDQGYLNDALEKALGNLGELASRPAPSQAPSRPYVVLQVRGRSMVVECDDIEFLESERRKVRFHAKGDVVESYGTLAEAADLLPDMFLQCHKSFIVNMDKVVEIGKEGILMRSGAVVPVSQKRRRAVKEALLDHLKVRV